MRIDKEEHRTALLDFIDQIAERTAFPDHFDKEVAELRAAIREAKIEEQDRIAVLERDRDALREHLLDVIAYVNNMFDQMSKDHKAAIDSCRVALEAKQ